MLISLLTFVVFNVSVCVYFKGGGGQGGGSPGE